MGREAPQTSSRARVRSCSWLKAGRLRFRLQSPEPEWDHTALNREGLGSPALPRLERRSSEGWSREGSGCAGLSTNTHLPPGQVGTSVSIKALTCLMSTVMTCFMMKIKSICDDHVTIYDR